MTAILLQMTVHIALRVAFLWQKNYLSYGIGAVLLLTGLVVIWNLIAETNKNKLVR
jgi:hypothetical protein